MKLFRKHWTTCLSYSLPLFTTPTTFGHLPLTLTKLGADNGLEKAELSISKYLVLVEGSVQDQPGNSRQSKDFGSLLLAVKLDVHFN